MCNTSIIDSQSCLCACLLLLIFIFARVQFHYYWLYRLLVCRFTVIEEWYCLCADGQLL